MENNEDCIQRLELVSKILQLLYPDDSKHPYHKVLSFLNANRNLTNIGVLLAFYIWDSGSEVQNLFPMSKIKELHSIYKQYKEVCILVGVPVWDVYKLHEWG